MVASRVHDVIIVCALFLTSCRQTNAFHASPWNIQKRAETDEVFDLIDMGSRILECSDHHYEYSPGTLTFISEGGKKLCSVFIAAPTDHVIELEMTSLDVDCADEGQVAILDGWELDGDIFPSQYDHPQPLEQRYLSFCGQDTPQDTYVSKQNVAHIKFFVPTRGQGFQVKVDFKINFRPCNILLQSGHYHKLTLRNYGLTSNCTVLSLYPQRVRFLYISVGERKRYSLFFNSRGETNHSLRTTCRGRLGVDSIQLFQGTGLNPDTYKPRLEFCGFRPTAAQRAVSLRCHSSSLRLQSSGEFFNLVKFAFLPMDNMEEEGLCQPGEVD